MMFNENFSRTSIAPAWALDQGPGYHLKFEWWKSQTCEQINFKFLTLLKFEIQTKRWNGRIKIPPTKTTGVRLLPRNLASRINLNVFTNFGYQMLRLYFDNYRIGETNCQLATCNLIIDKQIDKQVDNQVRSQVWNPDTLSLFVV